MSAFVVDNPTPRAEPALTQDEASRRAPSIGYLVKMIGVIVAVVGGSFTIGTKWGGNEASNLGAETALSSALARNTTAIGAIETRLRAVEDTKAALAPAVERLSAQVGELSKAQTDMRVGVTELVVEIRNLKEAVSELRAKVK